MAKSKSLVLQQYNEQTCNRCGYTFKAKESRFVEKMMRLHLSRTHNFTDTEIDEIFNNRRNAQQPIQEGRTRRNIQLDSGNGFVQLNHVNLRNLNRNENEN